MSHEGWFAHGEAMEARERHDGGRWRRGSCRRWWPLSLRELSWCGGGCGTAERTQMSCRTSAATGAVFSAD